jgi:dsRNA-specific ribonuclease
MGILARDTDRSAERAQIAILKSLPAWKKLELLGDACRTTRAVVIAGLRSRFPDVSDAALHRMLMDLMVGEETAERIWGPRARANR